MWIFLLSFFFFLLYFTLFLVNFGGLSLPCHLLCCLLLFVCLFSFFFVVVVVVCFSFFFLQGFSGFFLPSWIFWGFFVSLIALGTTSLRLVMSLWG